MRAQYKVHLLNPTGIKKANELATKFDELTAFIEASALDENSGRCLSIAKTKLEEACFFAKKAIAQDALYQQ